MVDWGRCREVLGLWSSVGWLMKTEYLLVTRGLGCGEINPHMGIALCLAYLCSRVGGTSLKLPKWCGFGSLEQSP